ncbi:MAG: arsenite methyltransferase [Mucilaginibacter polytrichastri]|nr:arsenite methyltransferase [Mucilaginibacter polytrichastri]
MKDQGQNSLKEQVRAKYNQIALQQTAVNRSSCCGAGGCSAEVYNIMSDDYDHLQGYESAADLGLGCGLPTEFARIRPGDTVVDLGSGAGNDCFVARAETGESGHVTGIDFSEEMLRKANANLKKLGYGNVDFRMGDIENIPVNDGTADVVVSNCVLNLVENKRQVFSGIFRILRSGGHFSISDIVLEGTLPEKLRQEAEMYAGCVAGAIGKTEYLSLITAQGFTQVQVQKQKPILIPDDILSRYLNPDEIAAFRRGKGAGICSITVFAVKP